MAEALMEKIEVNKAFLPYFFTSDEAHFHLDGQVNSKNNIFWGEKPPIEVAQKPLHSAKVTAWCAIWSKGIFGPYFFEEDGLTVTVNTERYLKVLEKFYRELERLYQATYLKYGFSRMVPLPIHQNYPWNGSENTSRRGSSHQHETSHFPSSGRPIHPT